MNWLADNAADLFGHLVTIIVFLGGFWILIRQAKIDIAKDRSIKLFDRSVESIKQSMILLEKIRCELYFLGIEPFERGGSLTPAIAHRLASIAVLRAEYFGESLFMPQEIANRIRNIENLFNEITPAINEQNAEARNDRLEKLNNQVSEEISRLRADIQQWVEKKKKTYAYLEI